MAKKFFIAAGHGGGDPGSAYNGWKEADANKLVVDGAFELLKGQDTRGVEFIKVPHDLDLQGAINWINKQENAGLSDWCLEVHFDAPSATARGNLVIVGKNDVGRAFGTPLKDEMAKATGIPSRGFIYNEDKVWANGARGFGFINYTEPLAAILECDMLSNPATADILNDPKKREVFAKGLVCGILKVIGSEYKEPSQPPPPPSEPIPPSDDLYRVIFKGNQLGAYKSNPIEKIATLETDLTAAGETIKKREEKITQLNGDIEKYSQELTTVRKALQTAQDDLVECKGSQDDETTVPVPKSLLNRIIEAIKAILERKKVTEDV